MNFCIVREEQPDILSCEKCENFFEKEVVVYGEEKDNLASVGLSTSGASVVHASVGAINPSVDTRRC